MELQLISDYLESIIDNIDQIDRGYSNIDSRLKSLGAEIERI